jgi:hypothetical protein
MTWKSDSIARRSLDQGNLRFLIPIPQRRSKSGNAVYRPLESCFREPVIQESFGQPPRLFRDRVRCAERTQRVAESSGARDTDLIGGPPQLWAIRRSH